METTTDGATISAAMRERAKAGIHMNRIPLGYVRLWTDSERKILKEEPTAGLVAEGFRLVLAGMSLRQVLAELTGRGLRNRNGRPLSLSSLHLFLTNPFYAGRVRFQGKTYPGGHELLVERAIFRNVQVALGNSRK